MVGERMCEREGERTAIVRPELPTGQRERAGCQWAGGKYGGGEAIEHGE